MTAPAGLTRGLCAVAMLAWSISLGGHPLAPAFLAVDLTSDGRAQVEWRVPLAVETRSSIEPRLPASCMASDTLEVTTDETWRRTRWRAQCGAWSNGDVIEMLGLELLDTEVLVRVRFADGRLARAVLSARQPVFEVPVKDTRSAVFRDYFRLGVAHLLGGADHLVFVIGLVLLVLRADVKSPVRRLAWTVTAFTLGHSISLALAALEMVRLPSGPIEVAIALSIVWLAAELAAAPADGDRRFVRPWWVAGTFGGFHGFGFAGALVEVGLPVGEIPAALLAFNVGLEASQLAVVLTVVPLGLLARAWGPGWHVLIRGAGYAGGVPAAYWALERGAALL